MFAINKIEMQMFITLLNTRHNFRINPQTCNSFQIAFQNSQFHAQHFMSFDVNITEC